MREFETEIRAVVWDMDGMLFDTERLSLIAWQQGARQVEAVIDEALFRTLIGRNSSSIRAMLRESLGAMIDVDELWRHAGIAYNQLLEEGPPLKPGAQECLALLRELGVPQAVATSTSKRLAEQKLSHHGLLPLLDALVTGDQVQRGKPDPEPYLLAASRLGVDPRQCIAFEDSVTGIQSAFDAGMYTVLVPDMAEHDEVSLARVRRKLDSLEDAVPLLRELFA